MADQSIAIYIRLSMADEETGKTKDESNSVVNQRNLINRFLDNHKELSKCPRTIYIDDGASGTNTDRPGFQRMIQAIRERRHTVCVTKDFSRFARDYIEMGDYLEYLFPLIGVRYISINDSYDSADYRGTTGGLDTVMRAIVYDAYSKDLSLKEHTGKVQSMKKGRRCSGEPCYGYRRDPERKSMDLLDEEAAGVVKRIFMSAINGMSPGNIAEMLNDDGVLTPGLYFHKKHPESKRYQNLRADRKWTYFSIVIILERYEYTGAAVGGKRKQLLPCKRETVQAEREDWIIVPGMHEAIVTEEEFKLAQKVLNKTGRPKPKETVYPLKSLVYCGHCGRTMFRYSKNHRFRCSYARNGGDEECRRTKTMLESELEKLVFSAIQERIAEGRQNTAATDKTAVTSVQIERKLKSVLRQAEELRKNKLSCYERYCSEDLDREEYLKKKQELDEQLEKCELETAELSRQRERMEEEKSMESTATASWEEYASTEKLTYEMAHCYLEKIIAYEDKKIEFVWKESAGGA